MKNEENEEARTFKEEKVVLECFQVSVGRPSDKGSVKSKKSKCWYMVSWSRVSGICFCNDKWR